LSKNDRIVENRMDQEHADVSPGRRRFLGNFAGMTATAIAASAIGLPPLAGGKGAELEAAEIGPLEAEQRRSEAYDIRLKTALFQKNLPLPAHPDNGDEQRYANKIGSYSKALPHNGLGEPDLSAYNLLLRALSTGEPSDFEAIPLGGAVKLSNPQSAYVFDLAGPDSHHPSVPEAPAFGSAWEASEMAEDYWQALTRDVPFSNYSADPLTLAAASDLSQFSDFRGPKAGGLVAPGTLFRGDTPGDLSGPYLSQFLWKNIPFGATTIVQKYHTAVAGDDFMKSYAEWSNIQNGIAPAASNTIDPVTRYIRSGRDLGEFLHRDFSYQGLLGACLILLSLGPAAMDSANPYLTSATQSGFTTFGAPHILDLTARAARVALEAVWYQKWLVHRRLRPEEFGGRVHNHLTGAATYPISSELLHSAAISRIFSTFVTYLLPIAYPEGCPTHPSYPAGHPTVAAAGVTILKAFFNESFVIPSPVEASTDGLSLLPYVGPALTVGGELNKLAGNFALGRDFAGVHWRSDGIEALTLGEAVAIGILQDYRTTYSEIFAGFSLTKFDGSEITV
jgi:hypothetical protein